MIIEDYVSFETAKLLKEKGFDEKGVKVWYDESGEMYYDRREIKYQIKIENHEKLFQCPTLQMAMKWLREVHSIDISIAVRFWNKDEDAIVKSWKYTVYRTDEIESFGQSNTYEEACEAAIKYCLKNLIKNEDGKKEVIEHPGKYGLQKPAECKATINGEPIATENQSVDIPLTEWSEEDEANFAWFDKFFRAESVVANGRDIPQDKYLWFKSLRTQPKKELSIDKAIKWFDDTFYFLDRSSGRGRYCEITTHDFDSLEEMYDSFRKAVTIDSQPHWKPTKTDVALFNKAVTTNKALTPAERAQLDIIRSKFGCCRAVNCDGIVQEEQCDENEVRLKEIIDLIGYSPISEKLENEYVSFLKSLSCKSASSKWIPAMNPPEKSELVITCSNDNGTPQCIGLSKYVNGKWYDLMDDEDEGYFNVDYWMPIPMF